MLIQPFKRCFGFLVKDDEERRFLFQPHETH